MTELKANTPRISARYGGMPVFRAGTAGGGHGLRGVATTGRGVVGIATEPGGIGVIGSAKDGRGVWAIARGEGTAVYAEWFRIEINRARRRSQPGQAVSPSGLTARSIFGGMVQVGNLFLEGTGHGAPPPGGAKLIAAGNSSGKVQLAVRFP